MKHPRRDGGGRNSLWGRRILHKVDALLNIFLQPFDASIQEQLLLVGNAIQHVNRLFRPIRLNNLEWLVSKRLAGKRDGRGKAYTKLYRNGKELAACLFQDYISSGDPGEIDIAWLYQSLFASDGFEELFGKAERVQLSDYISGGE